MDFFKSQVPFPSDEKASPPFPCTAWNAPTVNKFMLGWISTFPERRFVNIVRDVSLQQTKRRLKNVCWELQDHTKMFSHIEREPHGT